MTPWKWYGDLVLCWDEWGLGILVLFNPWWIEVRLVLGPVSTWMNVSRRPLDEPKQETRV